MSSGGLNLIQLTAICGEVCTTPQQVLLAQEHVHILAGRWPEPHEVIAYLINPDAGVFAKVPA